MSHPPDPEVASRSVSRRLSVLTPSIIANDGGLRATETPADLR